MCGSIFRVYFIVRYGLGVFGVACFVVFYALLAWVRDGLELWLYLVVSGWWYILEVGDLFLAQVYSEDMTSVAIRIP